MPQDDIAKLQAIIKESAVQQDRNAQVVVYCKYFRGNKYVENKVMMKFVYHYGYYYVYIKKACIKCLLMRKWVYNNR